MTETGWDDALRACMGRRVKARIDTGAGDFVIASGLLQSRSDETVVIVEERQWARRPDGSYLPVPERETHYRIADLRSITLPSESPEEAAVVLGDPPDDRSRIEQPKGFVLQ